MNGCHLKGTYKGQLLTTNAADPNNGWWHIARVVVEREAIEQWTWFSKYLSDDLKIENQFHYTFIVEMVWHNLSHWVFKQSGSTQV